MTVVGMQTCFLLLRLDVAVRQLHAVGCFRVVD